MRWTLSRETGLASRLSVLSGAGSRKLWHVLQVGPGGLGAIMAASGVGAFLGAACLLILPRKHRIGWMMTAFIVIKLTVCVLAWTRHLGLAIAAAAILSFGIASSLGVASTMVQESVPDALRGRLISLYALVFTGVMPFASMIVAWLADRIGMRRELVLVAALYAICSWILIPMLRRTSHGTDPDAEQLPAEKD